MSRLVPVGGHSTWRTGAAILPGLQQAWEGKEDRGLSVQPVAYDG